MKIVRAIREGRIVPHKPKGAGSMASGPTTTSPGPTISCLRQEEDREIFIVELPYVSMRIVEDVPTMLETTSELCDMLAVHGHASAVFLGHSLGTAVAHGW